LYGNYLIYNIFSDYNFPHFFFVSSILFILIQMHTYNNANIKINFFINLKLFLNNFPWCIDTVINYTYFTGHLIYSEFNKYLMLYNNTNKTFYWKFLFVHSNKTFLLSVFLWHKSTKFFIGSYREQSKPF
jgi:hypothetical protein